MDVGAGWIFGGWLFGGGRDDSTSRLRPHNHDTPAAPRRGDATAELLSRIQTGDRAAFDLLYEELVETLWSVAILQTRSADVAEEIVQDVFLWLWLHRESVKRDLDIRVYLATAVRNRARNLAQHRQTVDALASSAQHDGVARLGWSTLSASANVEAETREFYDAYAEALSSLTEREREVVLLRWEEGFTLEQIGQVLSLSIAGARKVLLRAQQKVQALLGPHRR